MKLDITPFGSTSHHSHVLFHSILGTSSKKCRCVTSILTLIQGWEILKEVMTERE
jgi:hypothetical protein